MAHSKSELLLAANEIRCDLIDKHPEFADKLRNIGIYLNGRLRTTAGRASHREYNIEINTRLLVRECNWSHLQELVIHEIAHLLVGPGHGHGPVWKNMVYRLGGTPTRTHGLNSDGMNGYKYKTYCHSCCRHVYVPSRHARIIDRGGYVRCGCGAIVAHYQKIATEDVYV